MPTNSFKQQTLDARPDRLDLRDREYRPPLRSLPAQWPLQEHIECMLETYTRDGMILDQEGEGACTGFGLAAVINYLNWRSAMTIDDQGQVCTPATIQQERVSPRMLYHMAKIYDEWEGEDYEGSSCRGAMKGWHRHGVCHDETWPYSTKKFLQPKAHWAQEAINNPLGAYYRINKDSVVDMQAAIYEVGAIYCSATVHAGWWRRKDPNLSVIEPDSKISGGHAFAIVGYNAEGFIVQNSWGHNWGYFGFAVLTYADWVEHASDAWVAVRGAPVNKQAPVTFAQHPLQTIDSNANPRMTTGMRQALRYPYEHTAAHPWSEEDAYKHSLVIGNDGRPKLTLVTCADPDASAKRICFDHVREWLATQSGKKRVLIYAHGGLNAEEDSINRVRVMAPYFKANGIYPIFISWKTGFLESISNQLGDFLTENFRQAGIDPASAKAQGILDKLREPIDRGIEKMSRHIMVRGVWNEMKENAQYASDRAVRGYPQQGSGVRPGAMVILSKALADLQKDASFDLHLMGHSAGSILFGYFLDELTKRKLTVNSISLFAPACTLEFANKHYIRACEKGVYKKSQLHIHNMDDERELADSVGPYGKSLLYLVSRALEDIHKMPLLGMAAAWEKQNASEDDGKFNTCQQREIETWLNFAAKGAGQVKHTRYGKDFSKVSTSLRGDQIDLSHGSFDNDVNLIRQEVQRLLNKDSLAVPIENLGGF